VGAAAACSRLLSLDPAHTAVALGLAATQAAGQGCMVGTMSKSFHAGKACHSGLLAALLAQNGVTASESVIECAKGFAATASGECDEATALVEPPMGWHIMSNLFKFDASCYMTHSTLAGIRELRAQHELNTDDIAKFRLHLGDVEFATCALPRPTTGLEVKFSAAHLAAMAALGRSTMVIEDAAPTVVEVILNDGRLLTAARDVNTPERDLALQRRRLEEKFRTITTPLLGAEDAEAVIAAVTLPAADLDVCAVSRLTRHLSSVSGAPR
jgi:MmgE/PrpD N-terminal domain/MmgE/PrpD C-terminal domain